MTSKTKKAIHALVTREAHTAWHQAADDAGVSLTGLLEALAIHAADQPDNQIPDYVIKTARQIDNKNRKRYE